MSVEFSSRSKSKGGRKQENEKRECVIWKIKEERERERKKEEEEDQLFIPFGHDTTQKLMENCFPLFWDFVSSSFLFLRTHYLSLLYFPTINTRGGGRGLLWRGREKREKKGGGAGFQTRSKSNLCITYPSIRKTGNENAGKTGGKGCVAGIFC